MKRSTTFWNEEDAQKAIWAEDEEAIGRMLIEFAQNVAPYFIHKINPALNREDAEGAIIKRALEASRRYDPAQGSLYNYLAMVAFNEVRTLARKDATANSSKTELIERVAESVRKGQPVPPFIEWML